MSTKKLARTLRTVRFLRPIQIMGQVRRRLRSAPAGPISKRVGPPPILAKIQPLVPFLGAPAHAYTDGWRRFHLLNRNVTFAACPEWDFGDEGPLWAQHLHRFDYARRATLAPEARRALMLDWIERHREGVGWESGPISHRAQTWIKLLLEAGALPQDDTTRAELALSLASQLTTLSQNLETHLLGDEYLSNLIALVMGGLAFEGRPPSAWLGFERTLREELAEQVLPDGAHVGRSPMYHSLLLESILDLVNVAAVAPRAPSGLAERLRETAGRMLGALAIWTHPDGEIALFGDSAFGVAQIPRALTSYAAALGIAPRGPARLGILENAGFVRISSGPFTVITSVAGPMPSYQPGHSHCDALAFELSVGKERVVTDTGVAEYLPGALREISRSTRAHATVEVNDADQAELWATHRIGGRPRVVLSSAQPGHRLEATCASWSTPDTLHRRVLEARRGGLEVRDTFEGRLRPVRFSLPLAPGLEPRLDERCARLRLRDGTWMRIDLPEGLHFTLERGLYFPEFGRTVERPILVGRAERLDLAVLRFGVAEVLRRSGHVRGAPASQFRRAP